MPIFRQRVFVTLSVTLAATVLGLLAGYAGGHYTLEQMLASRLSLDLEWVSREADRSLAEAHLTLAAMNASPYAPCSQEEQVYFRALLFESHFLKDLGRINANRIDCTVGLGHLNEPRVLPAPEMTLQDGTSIHKNLPLYASDDDTVVTLHQGSSYVVFRGTGLLQPTFGPEHFTESVTDAITHRLGVLRGSALTADAAILTSDGQGRQGNLLWETRCSTRGQSCVTASASIPDAVREERSILAAFMALGAFCFGVPGLAMGMLCRRRPGMGRQLQRAIRSESLHMVYLPVVDLQTRRIVGAEALVRWSNEDGLFMQPEVFVRVAEEKGFVTEITRLILKLSLRDFAATLRSVPGFRLNINVTASDLADSGFLPALAHALEEVQLPTQCLGIEISETGTAHQQIAMDAILQLRRRGHRVYIDDFGTGYSSLNYLRELAIDAIKIDRSITKAIGTDSVSVAMLPEILRMASDLDLQVVVEGIETTEQAQYFIRTGRHFLAQGWLFGRPLPLEEFRRLLAEDQKLDAANAQPNNQNSANPQ